MEMANTSDAVVRISLESDLGAITEIYEYYVLHTSSTFETEAPDEEEMARRRLAVVERGLPHLVAEIDGRVEGYAYAGPYRPRGAYRFTVEDSIYMRPTCVGRGIGRALMAALIDWCEREGYRQMIAVIGGADNSASIALHEKFGFRHAGRLTSAGWKFGRWHDSVLMQRALGEGDGTGAEEK